jgi:hypothetical protein
MEKQHLIKLLGTLFVYIAPAFIILRDIIKYIKSWQRINNNKKVWALLLSIIFIAQLYYIIDSFNNY